MDRLFDHYLKKARHADKLFKDNDPGHSEKP